jgi:hypothetical protein
MCIHIYSDISTNHIGQPVSVVDVSFIYSTYSYMVRDEEGTERRMEGIGQRTGKGKGGTKGEVTDIGMKGQWEGGKDRGI